MHYFINFKNYSEASINLFSNFTLLIGKNGSGKSNLIEGVELLASLAEGKPLHEMVDGKSYLPNAYPIRGGIHSCVKFGHDEFSLGFTGLFNFLGKNEPFDYRVSISVDPFPRISQEYLTVGTRKIFFAVTDGDRTDGMLDVQFDNFARGGVKPHRKIYGDRSIISRYEELIQVNEAGDKGNKLKAVQMVASIKRYIQSSFVFDPSPKLMRDYVRIGQNVLIKDGSNISAVLFSMHASDTKKPKSNTLENIINIVRQVPEEPFANFEFVQTSQHDVIFAIKTGERIVDARLISDGTLRVMAVITALETIPPRSRIIIEEFDNGLHPSRAELLLNSIREIVERRNLNILLSTHNPASLNSLDNEWLQNVHVCHWDSSNESSKLTRLMDIPKVDSLLESSGSLGDLVTRSVFEKHLQPVFEANKKAKALEWLERLK